MLQVFSVIICWNYNNKTKFDFVSWDFHVVSTLKYIWFSYAVRCILNELRWIGIFRLFFTTKTVRDETAELKRVRKKSQVQQNKGTIILREHAHITRQTYLFIFRRPRSINRFRETSALSRHGSDGERQQTIYQ